jgi:hypothetical protein
MLARYNICNCRGDKADSVVIIGGDTEDECADYAAETEALRLAGYADRGKCDGCGDSKFRAHFVEVVELTEKGRRIRISYDVVTPESAEIGDFADNGWEDEEGVCVDPDELDVEEHGSELAAVVDLAVKAIGNGVEASDYPTCCPGHTWYTEIDGETDYEDGSEKRLSYHLDGFSEDEELAIYAELTGRVVSEVSKVS